MALNSKSHQSRWYCYGVTMDKIAQISVLWENYLFPDTTLFVDYNSLGYTGSGYGRTWTNSLGNTFDPVSVWFNDLNYYSSELMMNKFMGYSLDSVGMSIRYERNIANPSIIDTLRFQIMMDPIYGPNMPIGGWAGSWLPQFNTDSVLYKRIKFTPSTNKLIGSGVYTYDVLLNQAFAYDTLADGSQFVQFATPQFNDIPPDYKVGLFVQFIPGYQWTTNHDTISNLNSVKFFSYEENGYSGYPIYPRGEYNCSYTGYYWCHWDSTYSGYGRVIPTWAWDCSWRYCDHLIWYKITANATGFNHLENNALSILKEYPNPAQDDMTVVFELLKSSKVSLSIYDLAGKRVLSKNAGWMQEGRQHMDLDLRDFRSGVYSYVLCTNDSQLSRKLLIQR